MHIIEVVADNENTTIKKNWRTFAQNVTPP